MASRAHWTLIALMVAGCDGGGLQVTPDHGPPVGGQPVRITGQGFAERGAALVHFGNQPARGVVVESDQLMTMLTPQLDAIGTFDVRIEFSDGSVQTRKGAYAVEHTAGIVVSKPGDDTKAGQASAARPLQPETASDPQE